LPKKRARLAEIRPAGLALKSERMELKRGVGKVPVSVWGTSAPAAFVAIVAHRGAFAVLVSCIMRGALIVSVLTYAPITALTAAAHTIPLLRSI